MKVNINMGHTKYGAGCGAISGKYNESEIVRLVGTELIRLLKDKGHSVTNSTVDNAATQNAYLQEVVRKANNSGANLFISLHCNASSGHTGHGVEVYTYKNAKLDQAVHICYEISRLGFRNRGIKDGTNMYVVKNTTMPAILVEMFFLDNATDQSIYTKNGYRGIAKAIANAIG